jgi:ADP-ribosylglycohydrolase
MLLGLAIGDALGNTSERLLPDERRNLYGEITNYLRNPYAGHRPVGLPSDDSQLTFWTVEQVLADGRIDPEHLAKIFCERRIFGMGPTTARFVEEYRRGADWREAAPRSQSASNGALMRIAAVLTPHLTGEGTDLWVDAVLCAALTHNDPASISACVAFVGMLSALLVMSGPPPTDWWVETYLRYAKPVEGRTRYQGKGQYTDYSGPLWRYVHEIVPAAWEQRLTAREAADSWHSGAYLLQTVPTVLYILMLHGSDPETAIIRAVNDTKDSDTMAAIVGAAVGALHGEQALPKRWRDGLLGRTMEDDDGQVFQLLEELEKWLTSAAN